MKQLNFNQIENINGGICAIPGNSQGGHCLPCAALAAMGEGLGPGGITVIICIE